MSSDAFGYSEARFAAHVGLSRDDAKFLRAQHLSEGEHWKKNGAGVVLTLPAVKLLWRALKSPPSHLNLAECEVAKKDSPSERLALPDRISEANPLRLTVAIVYPNPRMIRAKNDAGETFEVYVGNNANFAVGMSGLLCVPMEGHPCFLRLIGGVHDYFGKETRVLGLPPRRGRWW